MPDAPTQAGERKRIPHEQYNQYIIYNQHTLNIFPAQFYRYNPHVDILTKTHNWKCGSISGERAIAASRNLHAEKYS